MGWNENATGYPKSEAFCSFSSAKKSVACRVAFSGAIRTFNKYCRWDEIGGQKESLINLISVGTIKATIRYTVY